jgi:hypothetical protein
MNSYQRTMKIATAMATDGHFDSVNVRPSIFRCRFGRRNEAAGCSRERLPER